MKDVFKITMESGHSIKATSNHKFRAPCGVYGRWIEVLNLKVGDELCLEADNLKSSRVTSITPAGQEEVYDCTIPILHYFTANGFVSHNCSEQSLESWELCCLCELFPTRCTGF